MSDDCAGKTILILGAGVMQVPAIRLARSMGLRSLVVDADAKAPGAELADDFAAIDLRDEPAILSFARSRKRGPDGVFTAGTDFSAAVARIAGGLGLPGLPVQAALRASDKSLMRAAFREAGVPSPRFRTVDCTAAALSAAREMGFPLVIKPVDSMGARGCRRVDTEEELSEATSDAMDHSRGGKAIIEEYMPGKEYSVDAIVWKGKISICGLADRHIFFPPYFVEMGHTMPSASPRPELDEVIRVFKAGVHALGITEGAAKGDIKVGSDGKARVGEIAARLSGGYMSGWTFPFSSGIEVTRAAMRIALGLPPGDLEYGHDFVAAERAWISIPGTAREVRGEAAAAGMPCVRELFPRARVGSVVDFPRNNVQKCGNVIAVSASREEAIRAAEAAASSILIRLEAGDRRTGAFLSAPAAQWPGPAFDLEGSPFWKSIESLPESIPGPAGGKGPGVIMPELDLPDSPRDWQGRSLEEALSAALSLAGAEKGRGAVLLGRSFWKALLRGSYQGGAWVLDSWNRGIA